MRDSIRIAVKSRACVWNNDTGPLVRERANVFYSGRAHPSYLCGINNRFCNVFILCIKKRKDRSYLMKKFTKKMNSMMFDGAGGLIVLMVLGAPVLIGIAVIVLIIISVKLIKKARKKNIEAESKPESKDSSGEDE